MTAPINLNQARKARAKAQAKATAAENRVKFGRTKAEKSLADARRDKASRDLDASKRDED
ncbi:DUF4169 family protein [Caulobacter mirabilis]|uniref:DUF4169 domain-containing protein n=1 Tax=Caulobacter mirabilis TaxID=69666 RepID=A0A2D2B0I1_9CAUL|nr:DUF4169 family protein [Caulobacter mirabilis]ATQ43770.1 DUF4169 domain-containing protein [Caulobacter mirabilis]